MSRQLRGSRSRRQKLVLKAEVNKRSYLTSTLAPASSNFFLIEEAGAKVEVK
jgi:hypothetical protein